MTVDTGVAPAPTPIRDLSRERWAVVDFRPAVTGWSVGYLTDWPHDNEPGPARLEPLAGWLIEQREHDGKRRVVPAIVDSERGVVERATEAPNYWGTFGPNGLEPTYMTP